MVELSQHCGLATEWLPHETGSQEELREMGGTGRRLGGYSVHTVNTDIRTYTQEVIAHLRWINLVEETVDYVCEYRTVWLWQACLQCLTHHPIHLNILCTETVRGERGMCIYM